MARRASRPGNVRELQSLIDCAAALATPAANGDILIDVDLLTFARGGGSSARTPTVPRRSLDDEIATLETRLITQALDETGNNRSAAARLLAISRVGLLKKMHRLGLN